MRRVLALLFAALSFATLAQAVPERDLRAFCENPKTCEPIELNGTWGIDKGHVLSVDAIRQLPNPKETQVPGTWSASPLNPFSPIWNEAQDLGTFWLVLKNLTPEPGMGLHMPNVHGAYRIYWQPLNEAVNRPPLFSYGWNENNPRQSAANLRDHFINLPLKPAVSDYLLVIQVANQSLAKAGLRTAPRLGLLTDLQTDQFEHMLLYCLVIGATFIIGFYHFLIYLQRRSDHSALWLAVECLMIISHTVAMQRLYQYVVPEPSNLLLRVVTMMLYTPHIIAPIAFYAFLAFHFPRIRHRSAPYVFGIPAVILGLSFLAPLSFFARFYLIGFMPVMTAYILFIFARSVFAFRGDRDFQTIFAGIVILGLASIHDALAGSKASSSLVPFAEIIFIMMQGWLLSKRFAQAYNTASRLSRDLEKEVQRQTRDIRSILDTIQQGIVTVQDGNMNLGPEHSRTMGDWFRSALHGHNFELVLDQSPSLSSDRRDQIKEVLKASIGEDPMNFEINLSLLPTELIMTVHGQERHFELDWTPIVDPSGIIEKVLVCLRDVSEVRALRDQSRQNEEELRIIQELLNIPEDRFKTFVKKMHQYLAESEVLVGTLERKDSMNRLEAIR